MPITDLTLKNDNLIAATQGRGFWLIDDLTPLHQLTPAVAASKVHLFRPLASYRLEGAGGPTVPKTAGQNHPGGVLLHYYLAQKLDTASTLKLEILDPNGKLIRAFTNKVKAAEKDKKPGPDADKDRLVTKKGLNRFVWDMRYPEASKFDGIILWGGGTEGPKATPGTYRARLTLNKETPQETEVVILSDPRAKATPQDLQAQFAFLQEVRDKLSETNDAVHDIRTMRGQLQALTTPLKADAAYRDIVQAADAIDKKMTTVEEALYQTKNRSGQDPLNFPIRLNNKLANLVGQASEGNYAPTDQVVAFKKEIAEQIDQQLSALKQLREQDVPALNKLIRDKAVDAISMPKPKPAITPTSL